MLRMCSRHRNLARGLMKVSTEIYRSVEIWCRWRAVRRQEAGKGLPWESIEREGESRTPKWWNVLHLVLCAYTTRGDERHKARLFGERVVMKVPKEKTFVSLCCGSVGGFILYLFFSFQNYINWLKILGCLLP